MDNIYNNSDFILQYKIPKIVNSWLLVLKTILILFIISLFIPYNTYKTYIGYVSLKDNNSYIILPKNTKLNKNLYINGKKYEYKIINTDNNIEIKIDLEEDLKIDSLYINVDIKDTKKTLFKILKSKIKKGIGL